MGSCCGGTSLCKTVLQEVQTKQKRFLLRGVTATVILGGDKCVASEGGGFVSISHLSNIFKSVINSVSFAQAKSGLPGMVIGE